MKSAMRNARLGREEELSAIRRLDDQARLIERSATGASFAAHVAEEFRRSPEYGGRSVFGFEAELQPLRVSSQRQT